MNPDPIGKPGSLAALERYWPYQSSQIAPRVHVKRLKSWMTGRNRPPEWSTIRPPFQSNRWNILFLYAPSGDLDSDQIQILKRVAAMSGPLLVVAAMAIDRLPHELDRADALIVKATGGFDFSAYRVALDVVAQNSPGATAYVQNDSVYGPFGDIDDLVSRAPWDLTGFMAARAVESHISSFAFILRDVTPSRMAALRPVLSPDWSCDDFNDVILLQETRLARIAARTMSVGAYWYLPTQPDSESFMVRVFKHLVGTAVPVIDTGGDATLSSPIELLDAGFPFVKRSLLTKFAGLHSPDALREAIRGHGWQAGSMH